MKLEQLTFTRFLAAIAIVIYHYGLHVFPFNLESINFLFQKANVGVSYFFILSGFVMIIAYGHKDKIDFIDYIQKRLARLYPLYAFAILFLLSAYLISRQQIDKVGLLLNFTLLQSWVPEKALSINTPGWSLSTEMFFYLSFPLLFNLFYKKANLKNVILGVILIFLVSQSLFHYLLRSEFYEPHPSAIHKFLFYFPLMHLNEFLIGNAVGLVFIKFKFKSRNFDILIIGLVACLCLLLKFKLGINFHNGMLAFLFVPLILLISLNNGILTKISTTKPLIFLGEISYGIYILQNPVFRYGNTILKSRHFSFITSPELIFGLNLLGLIVFAGICYKYIELPLRNKIVGIKLK